MLVAQRNRYKADAQLSAAEAERARALLLGVQTRADELKCDNLRLYERLRYLESYKARRALPLRAPSRCADARTQREGKC